MRRSGNRVSRRLGWAAMRWAGAFLMGAAMAFAAPLTVGGAEGAPGGTVEIRAFGAEGDGETDDTGAFLNALEALGDEGGALEIAQGRFVADGVVFPSNVTLAFRGDGQLVAPSGGNIEINGVIEAGMTEIFPGEGAVAGQVQNLHVFPQWFGAVGDGIHDDAPAIQRAADLPANAMGRTLFIPSGEYLFRGDIAFRCNVESHGLLVKEMEIDEDRTQFSQDLFLPTHYPKENPHISFEPDHPAQELDPEPFLGVAEGDLEVPVSRDVPLADGSGSIDLLEGGTLRFYSSDFFTSRRVRKGDHYYDKNDMVQMVSGRGDVFPEFAFSYDPPTGAEEWSEDAVYDKGDYSAYGGEIFKATWPSGEGSDFEHAHHDHVAIGPVEPDPGAASTAYRFEYEDGPEDSINVWRRVRTQVWYREKDCPVTVNGLRVEVRLEGHGGETKRLNAGAVNVNRSNMTFNNLEISVRDPEATMSRLLNSRQCVNVDFNNGYFSGATSHHLGYNILNSNIANFRYNDCVSTNSRKGLDGRHGKNVTIQGGYYNVVEDHYGRNYVIRGVTVSGLSTYVPGDSTPDADLQEWGFTARRPFGFSGANLHIENCVVDTAGGGILGARGDVGDLYGSVVLRDIHVRRNEGDVTVFAHWIDSDFDYAHEVRTPDRLIVEDVRLENPGRLRFNIGSGFDGGAYGPVDVRNTGPIGHVQTSSEWTRFADCRFEDAGFSVQEGGFVNIRNSVFAGAATDLSEDRIGKALGNVREPGAELSFPLEYVNSAVYEGPGDTGGNGGGS